MRTVARVFAYLRRYPGLATGTMACAIVATLLAFVFPKITQLVGSVRQLALHNSQLPGDTAKRNEMNAGTNIV